MSFSARELKQTLISLLVEVKKTLKLSIQALRSYLKLSCEYELHILPITKTSAAEDEDKNYIKVRPPLVHHVLRNRLFHRETKYYASVNSKHQHPPRATPGVLHSTGAPGPGFILDDLPRVFAYP